MVKYYYEVFLNNKDISKESWDNYLKDLDGFLGVMHFWQIIIKPEYHKIRYYIASPIKLPISFNNPSFLLKKCDDLDISRGKYRGIYYNNVSDNTIDIINNLYKKNRKLFSIVIHIRGGYKIRSYLGKIEINYHFQNKLYKKKLFFKIPINVLTINFAKIKSYTLKSTPKYLTIDKVMHLFRSDCANATFKIATFPYLEDNYYLTHNSYDFAGHSLVLGSSGSGKSKFLALLINNIYHTNKDKYKVIVIDPHDTLKDDLGEVENTVIDFKSDRIIDLFKSNISDINANVELFLSLFKSLINDSYNAKMERVLRYSIYILLKKGDFSFTNLRKLLLDLDYRNNIISELKRAIPTSVSYFFLTDFNELKTSSYNEAISPIISFIDEMQMVPVFSDREIGDGLLNIIKNNFLSIFSLNRINLGDKVTKTIAGLLMQQLFMIAEEQITDEHIIFIIDEVAVVENPILARFLSEMRKFNVSVVLAGQYFSQISENLKDAIFANVLNYYVFRVSRNDAITLSKNLEIKLVNSEDEDDKYKMLTNLKNQECVVRLSKNGCMFPTFKAKTVNYIPKVRNDYQNNKFIKTKKLEEKVFDFNFKIDNDITASDIMHKSSTSRKKVS